MWSIYDTLVLLTGIITAAIAVLPVENIPAGTRVKSAAIGGGLILLALFLGSLRSFRYPSLVFVGPLIALVALGVVVADARKRSAGPSLQFDEQGHGTPVPDPAPSAVAGPAPVVTGDAPAPQVARLPVDEGGAPQVASEREAAWGEVHDSGTSAARLAEIAERYPEFGPSMLDHPHAYAELRQWIRNLPGGAGGIRTEQ